MLQPLAPVSPCIDTQLCLALSARSEPQIGLALKGISLTTGTRNSPNKIKYISEGLLCGKIHRKHSGSTVQYGDGAELQSFDFCFVHGQQGCIKLLCFTKVLSGEARLETCVHQLSRIPRHVSSLEVGKAVFSLLGAGEHGSYSKINTAHLSGAVWQRGVCQHWSPSRDT